MFLTEAKLHDFNFINNLDSGDPDLYFEHSYLKRLYQKTVDKHRSILYDHTSASRGLAEFMLSKPSEYRKKMGSATYARMDKKRKQLLGAFNDAPAIGTTMHVYCGLNTPHAKTLVKLDPGKKFKTKTILSTSLSPRKAYQFAKAGKTTPRGNSERVVLHLELPEHTKGLYVYDASPHPSEHEYILPPKSIVQITGKQTVMMPDADADGNNQRTIISGKLIR